MSGILFILLALPIWLIPLRVASRYGMIKWFSPLHLLAFYAFMGTFLKSIGMLILPGEAFMYRFIYSDSSLYLGYIYTLGFTVCICLGYVLAIRERAPQVPRGAVSSTTDAGGGIQSVKGRSLTRSRPP